MVRLLSSIPKEERLHSPGTPYPGEPYHVTINGTLRELTDVQLLAMTLNEGCCQQGKGFFFWYPEQTHHVMILFYNIR